MITRVLASCDRWLPIMDSLKKEAVDFLLPLTLVVTDSSPIGPRSNGQSARNTASVVATHPPGGLAMRNWMADGFVMLAR